MTAKIELTQGLVALVDEEDFEWLSQWKWCVAKTSNCIYAKRTNKAILMHRELMVRHGYTFQVVDHANHDGLDNRKANLRPCSQSENQANRRKTIGSSQFKGVHLEAQTGRWRAEIRHDGKRLRGPRFTSELEAAAWYDEKAWELFGDFALLNGSKL
jgi:hypothetical protein